MEGSGSNHRCPFSQISTALFQIFRTSWFLALELGKLFIYLWSVLLSCNAFLKMTSKATDNTQMVFLIFSEVNLLSAKLYAT